MSKKVFDQIAEGLQEALDVARGGDIPHLTSIPEHCRIAPFEEGGSIEERVDEIVALEGRVHIEMMDDKNAWMRIGSHVFWMHSTKKGLVIRWHETYRKPRGDIPHVETLPPPPVLEEK